MMRKHASRKHAAPQRKGARGRMKSRGQKAGPQGSYGETGLYDPSRGEATS